MPEYAVERGKLSPGMLACQGPGQVHSVFRRTVNLMFSGRMLTLADAVMPDMPDTLYLPDGSSCQALRAQEGVPTQWKGDTLLLGRVRLWIGRSVRVDHPYCPPTLTWCYLEQLLAVCESIREPDGLDRLPPHWQEKAEMCLEEYAAELALGGDGLEPMDAILGLGVGSTPSADDALLAISALIRGRIWCRPGALDRTSAISAKYLRCAQEGCYAVPLIRLLTKPQPESAKVLAACGATSGRDMLHGLRTACRQLMKGDRI